MQHRTALRRGCSHAAGANRRRSDENLIELRWSGSVGCAALCKRAPGDAGEAVGSILGSNPQTTPAKPRCAQTPAILDAPRYSRRCVTTVAGSDAAARLSGSRWPGQGRQQRRRATAATAGDRRDGGRGTAGGRGEGRWRLDGWENSGRKRGAGGVEGGPGSQRLHNSHGLGRSEKAAERPAILASSPTTLRSEPGLPSLPLPPPSSRPPSTGHDTPAVRCLHSP